jgi:hypothetical protein
MPATPQISLDIRLNGSTDPGWVNVKAANGTTYGYKYSGGDDGAGGLVQTVDSSGNGRDTAPFQLVADNRYQIAGVNFLNDPLNQLTWNGNSGRAGSIVDANSQVETAEYTVIVTDTQGSNALIVCDPQVKNQPPS